MVTMAKAMLQLIVLLLLILAPSAMAQEGDFRRPCTRACKKRPRGGIDLRPKLKVTVGSAPIATRRNPEMNQPRARPKGEPLLIESDDELRLASEEIKGGRFPTMKYSMILIKGVSSLLPLQDLTNFPGQLQIQNTENLTSVRGLESLERVGELTIQNNANLDDLSQLSGLVAVAEDMRVKGNGRLRSFATPNLESIGGNLVIERNQDLQSVVYPALESVGGSLKVRSNPSLEAMAFPALLGIGRDLSLEGSGPLLEDMSGFSSLARIGKDLQVLSNAGLRRLDGLGGAAIRRDLVVRRNPRLEDVNDLASVGRDAIIEGNNARLGGPGGSLEDPAFAMGGTVFSSPDG